MLRLLNNQKAVGLFDRSTEDPPGRAPRLPPPGFLVATADFGIVT
jgi:hypothetical protein